MLTLDTERSRAERARAVALLESEPLRHVVTLKMLAFFGDHAELRLLEDGAGWALRVVLPTNAFEYDARHYGHVPHVVLVNGSSDAAKLTLLAELPRSFVLKTGDVAVQRFARSVLGVEAVRSFTSFTSVAVSVTDAARSMALTSVSSASGRASTKLPPEPRLFEGSALDEAARALFTQTIYEEAELEKYFDGGAHWFAWRVGARLVSGCFVFQNFGAVWEVAGVFTEAAWRRQGLGATVVRAAIAHLTERGLQPRYQVETSNLASVALARRLGLDEFIEHFVVCG